MKTLPTKQMILTLVLMFVSFNFFSQVFWSEDFGTANSNEDQGDQVSNFTGANGLWTLSSETENGLFPNKWCISSLESGRPVGSCNKSSQATISSGNKTLHIGKKLSSRNQSSIANSEETAVWDNGAYYNANSKSLTDVLAESPIINCTSRESIRLSFDYFCGAKPGAVFMVYYYDGEQWEFLDRLRTTKAGTCDASKKMMWMKSDTYTLPGSINNNPNFKIGFRWINDTITGSDPVFDLLNPGLVNEFYSVAIDNIIVGGTYVDPNNNLNRTANNNINNTSKIDIKTIADKKNNPNIVFTTYSEKFPANDLIVESSTDGTEFNELSKIKSKAVKGSVTKLEYNYTDAEANDGVNYYRIKQVNADKTTVISKIVSVDHIKAKNITFTVYPKVP